MRATLLLAALGALLLPRAAARAAEGPSPGLHLGRVALSGPLERAEVLASLDQVELALDACYRERTKAKPRVGGTMLLRLRVDGQGAIRDATVVEDEVYDPPLAACFERSPLGIGLGTPRRAEASGVRIALTIVEPSWEAVYPGRLVGRDPVDGDAIGGVIGGPAPGDPTDAEAGTARVRTDAPLVLGALDKSDIEGEIKRHLTAIRVHYTHSRTHRLRERTGQSAKLVVTFVIDVDGTVRQAMPKRQEAVDRWLVERVLDVFLSMRFPAPSRGGVVLVSYPIVFR